MQTSISLSDTYSARQAIQVFSETPGYAHSRTIVPTKIHGYSCTRFIIIDKPLEMEPELEKSNELAQIVMSIWNLIKYTIFNCKEPEPNESTSHEEIEKPRADLTLFNTLEFDLSRAILNVNTMRILATGFFHLLDNGYIEDDAVNFDLIERICDLMLTRTN